MSSAVATPANTQGTVIVGAGISGLYSALLALDSGQKDIHVYEATDRVGGKIKSTVMNGQVLNMGAEFIDADHERLVKLCKRLGLGLNECHDQKRVLFQGPDGNVMWDFLPKYAPIAHQVMRDREAMENNPGGAHAHMLQSMTLSDYLAQLGQIISANEGRGFFAKLWDAVTFKSNRVPQAVLATAAQSYASEVGQPPEHISAAQYIAETSPSAAKFLGSDCGYRVEGGTEAMVTALHQYLAAHGVHFHFHEKLESATKGAQGGVDLTFSGPQGAHVHSNHAVIG